MLIDFNGFGEISHKIGRNCNKNVKRNFRKHLTQNPNSDNIYNSNKQKGRGCVVYQYAFSRFTQIT